MKKVLFVASIEKHILRFHIPSLKWFKDRGWEVHVACNGTAEIPYCDFLHQVDFIRSPFSIGHFKALRQLKAILRQEQFDLVHTHTPMASVLARIACKPFREGGKLKLLYTAHGFHFFKGSPRFYWMTYYPVEKWLAPLTDCLITINEEDYNVARKDFKALSVKRISGVGVDAGKFKPGGSGVKIATRKELGIPRDAFVIIYVAEFIYRKNHEFIIRAASALKKEIPDIEILFAGRGELMEKMKLLAAELGVGSFIHFLGFRRDIYHVINAADAGVSSSRQEGLGMNLLEEMMCGLPVVATIDRGHNEFVRSGQNGYLFSLNNPHDFISQVKTLSADKMQYARLAEGALKTAQKFNIESAIAELGSIYEEYI